MVGMDLDEHHRTDAASSWAGLLSSAQLLQSAAEEWRPYFQLMRRVCSQFSWPSACRMLGQELLAVAGTEDAALCVAVGEVVRMWRPSEGGPPGPPEAWPLLGDEAAASLPDSVAQIASDGTKLCLKLSHEPGLWLLLAEPVNQQATKALAVMAPELGEALSNFLREMAWFPGPATEAQGWPEVTNSAWVVEFRRRLLPLDEQSGKIMEPIVALQEAERGACDARDRIALEQAWQRHDSWLQQLRDVEVRRENAWREAFQKLAEDVSGWSQLAQARVRDWCHGDQARIACELSRLGSIARLIERNSDPDLATTEQESDYRGPSVVVA